jgi:outer membrane lipopolysaccharide assembly protein LptE/RlpB
MKEINIQYGALAKSIEEQLNEQGCTLGENQELINKLIHALTMCRFHLLTDSQYNAGLKKLHKKVMDSIKPLEVSI